MRNVTFGKAWKMIRHLKRMPVNRQPKHSNFYIQSMYHFRVAHGARPGTMADLYLVREIKPEEMVLPIRNRP